MTLPHVVEKKGAVKFQRIGKITGDRSGLNLRVVRLLGYKCEPNPNRFLRCVETRRLPFEHLALSRLSGVRPDLDDRRCAGLLACLLAAPNQQENQADYQISQFSPQFAALIRPLYSILSG